MCPSHAGVVELAAFPSDGFTANGLSVRGAEEYSGVPRRLTIWGGTITSISGPAHAGSVNGNSTADFLVRFTLDRIRRAPGLGWPSRPVGYWNTAGGGARDGAGEVSGAPWHMRTLQLDGAGQQEPGPQHPAERHRRRAAAPALAADPEADADADAGQPRAHADARRRTAAAERPDATPAAQDAGHRSASGPAHQHGPIRAIAGLSPAATARYAAFVMIAPGRDLVAAHAAARVDGHAAPRRESGD